MFLLSFGVLPGLFPLIRLPFDLIDPDYPNYLGDPPLLDAAVSQTILHRDAIFFFIYFLRVSYA